MVVVDLATIKLINKVVTHRHHSLHHKLVEFISMKLVNKRILGIEMRTRCARSLRNRPLTSLRTGLLSQIDRLAIRIHHKLSKTMQMTVILIQLKKLIILITMAVDQVLSMLLKFNSIHNKLRKPSR